MATPENTPCTAQEPLKHEDLFYAIARIDLVRSRLDGITDKIQGHPTSVGNDDRLEACSLGEILSVGAQTVDDKVNGLQDSLTTLEKLIF